MTDLRGPVAVVTGGGNRFRINAEPLPDRCGTTGRARGQQSNQAHTELHRGNSLVFAGRCPDLCLQPDQSAEGRSLCNSVQTLCALDYLKILHQTDPDINHSLNSLTKTSDHANMTVAPGNSLSQQIIGLAMREHTEPGPGLVEANYERCPECVNDFETL